MLLVKILMDDDGEKRPPLWHLVQNHGDAPRTVCSGEVFGYGETSGKSKTKQYIKGGITCPNCIEIVKWFKAVKL